MRVAKPLRKSSRVLASASRFSVVIVGPSWSATAGLTVTDRRTGTRCATSGAAQTTSATATKRNRTSRIGVEGERRNSPARRESGVFDDRSGFSDWEILVQQDPTTKAYSAIRRQNNRVTETFEDAATVTSAEAQFDKPYKVGLHPTRPGRYYYNLSVDIQTLTETDLDALQQWLHGPTAPNRSNPLKALQSGIGRLFSRMLGGGRTHYEERSGVFSVP